MSIPKYYESEETFEKIHHLLKQYPCPFCKLIGCLILHGFLTGYSDTDNAAKAKRGHRIFCSDRNSRRGCGRTMSCLLSHIIKHFIFTANTIWRFIANILTGMCKAKAMSGINASRSAPYGIWRRLRSNATHIRTCLSKVSAPPDTASSIPEIQTVEHLQAACNGSTNPIASFQLLFQTSFFAIPTPKPGALRL